MHLLRRDKLIHVHMCDSIRELQRMRPNIDERELWVKQEMKIEK